jgi:hypothetical protein
LPIPTLIVVGPDLFLASPQSCLWKLCYGCKKANKRLKMERFVVRHSLPIISL